MPRILITGGTGQVGTCLQALDWPVQTVLLAPGRADFNLCDPAAMRRWLDREAPDAIVNSGAYTAVDKAEGDSETARTINGDAPGVLAAYAARAGIPIVHLSTDYVFDGASPEPYRETDPTGPVGVYGRSKLAGEAAIRASGARAVIVRTAWVLSPHGANFAKTMLRLGSERDRIGVVADQIGNPTAAADIAAAVRTIVLALLADAGAPPGTYHFVNSGEASWHGLATAIFARAQTHGRTAPQVDAIPSSAYPTPAQRPANSRLATDAIARDYAIHPRAWRDAVDDVVDAIIEQEQTT